MVGIKYAQLENLTSWMKLVRTVRWNFPGLETEEGLKEYEQTVVKNMDRKSAICAVDAGVVVGVLLFSTKYNMLACLAVSPEYRRMGIATKMIQLMMENLDQEKEITVTTFCDGDPLGIAPRELYKKLGFVEGEFVKEFDYPNQRMILAPGRKDSQV